MAEIRHLENRHDVIFLPWAVPYGRNLADWCRMPTAVIYDRNRNAEVEFQYGRRLFFHVSEPRTEQRNLVVDRHDPSEESDVTKCETGSKIPLWQTVVFPCLSNMDD